MTTLIHSTGLAAAAVISLGFAILARVMGAVTDGGALVGTLVAFVFLLSAGLPGFLALALVFVIAAATTRWGRARKQLLGVAERREGRRAAQIAANLGAATFCVLPTIWFRQFSEILWVGAVAALAEAAADTASSEVGEASANIAYLITSFRPAPIGSNGAVSLEGTLSGCIAASVVAWAGAFCGLVSFTWTPVIALGGIAGMFLDSLLGATWENQGRMGNNSVNFVSTVFAAELALVAGKVLPVIRG